MAVDDKNFARDDGIDGNNAEIVREMFKRAGIKYNLTLRFPWESSLQADPGNANYGLFSHHLHSRASAAVQVVRHR